MKDTVPLHSAIINACENNQCAAQLLTYFTETMRGIASLDSLGEMTGYGRDDVYRAAWLLERKGYVSIIIQFYGWLERTGLRECIRYTATGHTIDAIRVISSSPTSKGKSRLEHKYKSEAAKVAYHNRRAEEYGLPATLTIDQWIQTLEHFNWKCAYCGEKYTLIEHFVPLGYEEGTTWANCVPGCHRCNRIKGPYHPQAFPSKLLREWGKTLLTVQQYLETRRSEAVL